MTILDRIKEKFSYVEGIDEAANISEALAVETNLKEYSGEPIATILEKANEVSESAEE